MDKQTEKERRQQEMEEKKEYLKSYQRHRRREEQILEEIQRLRMDKMFPSVANDGMPRGSSQTDLSDYMVLIDEQIQLLKEERLERAKALKNIESSIRAMKDEEEREVLRKRYIEGMKWEEVAVAMGYSWKQIHRIHASALNNFKMT